VLNSATRGEDAPSTTSTTTAPMDTHVIDMILGKSDTVLMRENMAIILSSDTSLDAKVAAFENLELLAGQIDNAKDLEPLKLWTPLLGQFVSEEPVIRSHAVWVCGAAIQNSTEVKKAFVLHGGLNAVNDLFKTDQDYAVRNKCLYCLSGLLQNSPDYVKEAENLGVFDHLSAILYEAEKNHQVASLTRRVIFMMRSLTVQMPSVMPAILRAHGITDAILELVRYHASEDNHTTDEDLLEKGICLLMELASLGQLNTNEMKISRHAADQMLCAFPNGLPGMSTSEWSGLKTAFVLADESGDMLL